MLDSTVEKYSADDLKNFNDKELEDLLEEQEKYFTSFKNLQMSVKIFMNSVYGALANIWFGGFTLELPLSITTEGQRATKLSIKFINHYFHNIWHKDTEIHKIMGLSNIRKITDTKDMVVAADTDSVACDTLIYINNKETKIEDGFEKLSKLFKLKEDLSGNQVIKLNDITTKNWSKNKGVHNSNVSNIIRHRVKKKKWKLKTKSGKTVVVTNDHSMIVMRNEEKITVKPSEILKSDRIVILKK